MGKLFVVFLAAAVLFCFSSFSFTAGWDACKGCHSTSGKPAPSRLTY